VNVAGIGGLLVIETLASQLSEPVAAGPVYVAWQFAFACSVIFAGHVIVGGTASTTVTVCVQVAVLPESSVAVQTML
jgi:hypothetical protein